MFLKVGWHLIRESAISVVSLEDENTLDIRAGNAEIRCSGEVVQPLIEDILDFTPGSSWMPDQDVA